MQHVLTATPGYEDEAPPEGHYGNRGYRDEDYSPSPPHASGGSYYPNNTEYAPPPPGGYYPNTTEFPPPPTGAPPPASPEFTHTGSSAPHPHPPADAPIPPYNPQDYASQPGTHDPYGYPPPKAGDNVSNVPPVQTNISPAASGSAPYFPPPPPAAPSVPSEPQHLRDGGAPSFLSCPVIFCFSDPLPSGLQRYLSFETCADNPNSTHRAPGLTRSQHRHASFNSPDIASFSSVPTSAL
jgi:hypothetical protein